MNSNSKEVKISMLKKEGKQNMSTGVKISSKNLRGLKIFGEKLRGLKILWEKLRGLKILR